LDETVELVSNDIMKIISWASRHGLKLIVEKTNAVPTD
jgi:hypothetical protein